VRLVRLGRLAGPAGSCSMSLRSTSMPEKVEADEVADLVVFLAGGRAGNVTGSDFVIDGGFIKTL
jgi:hypothetical protein